MDFSLITALVVMISFLVMFNKNKGKRIYQKRTIEKLPKNIDNQNIQQQSSNDIQRPLENQDSNQPTILQQLVNNSLKRESKQSMDGNQPFNFGNVSNNQQPLNFGESVISEKLSFDDQPFGDVRQPFGSQPFSLPFNSVQQPFDSQTFSSSPIISQGSVVLPTTNSIK